MELKDYEIMFPLPNGSKSAPQYKCNRCEKGFTTAGNLKRHILNIHLEDKTRANEIKYCQYCHKTYSRQDYLTQHIKSVHERANKYKCEECGKSYTQKGSLTRHITSIHQNIREFCCKHCNYQAISYNDLKKHAANAHFNRSRYECSICGHASWNASIIKQHIISIHTSNAKTQSRKCKYCGVVINLSNESYPLHVAACKTMGVMQSESKSIQIGKRKRKDYTFSKDTDQKTSSKSSKKVLTEEIPWELLCDVKDDTVPMETPLETDHNELFTPAIAIDCDSNLPGKSSDSSGSNNIVESVIAGYIKDLQEN